MNDTEKKDAENAGDQDENVNAAPTPGHPDNCSCGECAAPAPGQLERYLEEATRPACGVLATHDRHVLGDVAHPIHCAGYQAPEDQQMSYVSALQLWTAENPWSSKYGTLIHHAQVLARKLDRAGDEAPAALSSAYLQAISRLERMRPGAVSQGDDGDGLTPAGKQPSLFDPIED